jgi:hypothetical protein
MRSPWGASRKTLAPTGVYYVAPYLGLVRPGIFAASRLILLVATAANVPGVQAR